MTTIRTLAFAGFTVIASMGAAAAATASQIPASQFRALYQDQGQLGAMSNHYDHSGTSGRLEYGASPFHPEGPGNVSD